MTQGSVNMGFVSACTDSEVLKIFTHCRTRLQTIATMYTKGPG